VRFISDRKRGSSRPIGIAGPDGQPTGLRKQNERRKKKSEYDIISINARQKAKKDERATSVVLFLTMLLFGGLVLGTIYIHATRDRIPTMIVERTTVLSPTLHQGVIIRDENVYNGNYRGQVSFAVDNHSRVTAGTLVATIRDVANIQPLEEENEDLARQILDMQANREPISAYADSARHINNQIREINNNQMFRLASADMTAMLSLEAQINDHITVRNNMLLSENRGQLEPYVNRAAQNEASIARNTYQIRADEGGIVSQIVDGFEGQLTPDTMGNLSFAQTRTIVEHEYLQVPNFVRPFDDVFRIVNSNVWYVAAHVENIHTESLSQGMSITIYIDKEDYDFKAVDGTIHTLSRGMEYTYIIFSTRDFMLDFIDKRSVSFKLESGEYTGLKITQNALATRTFLLIPREYVEVIDNSHYITRSNTDGTTDRVEIMPRTLRNREVSEDYIYVLQDFDNITLGDRIIASGYQDFTISQVLTDTGIFRANFGVTTFISIDLDNMIYYGEYVILSSALNQGRGGINVHDRIISDAVNYYVTEGQVVSF